MSQTPWPPPSTEQTQSRSVLAIVFIWIGCYATAFVVSAIIAMISGGTTIETQSTGQLALMAIGLWLPFIAMLSLVARRDKRSFRDSFGLRFKKIDWLGLPLGVLCQVLLMNAVNWPLQQLWPHTFDPSHIERRARDMVDSAQGAWVGVLALVVVIGAPVVEELVYRGFIQGGLQARIGTTWSVLIAAAWFTLVHLEPIEFPGLFAFSIVLGICYWRTQRVGLSMVTHLAFNATGLLLVALS